MDEIVETKVAFLRLNKPTNFGPSMIDVQFIGLVIASKFQVRFNSAKFKFNKSVASAELLDLQKKTNNSAKSTKNSKKAESDRHRGAKNEFENI